MEETKGQTITVNGTEFEYEGLSPEVKLIVKHIQECDDQVAKLNFDLDNVKVARIGWMNILTDELFKKEEAIEPEVVE